MGSQHWELTELLGEGDVAWEPAEEVSNGHGAEGGLRAPTTADRKAAGSSGWFHAAQ